MRAGLRLLHSGWDTGVSRVVGCFINMASVGYSSLEIGPEVLFSQLAALSMAIVIIWIHSLCSVAGADAK